MAIYAQWTLYQEQVTLIFVINALLMNFECQLCLILLGKPAHTFFS